MLTSKLGPVFRNVAALVEGFEHRETRLVTRSGILGGEPAFPVRRLAVRHVGALVGSYPKGEPSTGATRSCRSMRTSPPVSPWSCEGRV